MVVVSFRSGFGVQGDWRFAVDFMRSAVGGLQLCMMVGWGVSEYGFFVCLLTARYVFGYRRLAEAIFVRGFRFLDFLVTSALD